MESKAPDIDYNQWEFFNKNFSSGLVIIGFFTLNYHAYITTTHKIMIHMFTYNVLMRKYFSSFPFGLVGLNMHLADTNRIYTTSAA